MISGDMKLLANGNLQLNTPEHGTLTLTRWRINPLNLRDLNNFNSNEPVSITFSDLNALEDGKITEVTASVRIPNLLGTYCLVKGGWLPPGLGMLNTTAFADRNFISKLSSFFQNNKPKSATLDGWFDDLRNFDLQLEIVPYAIEANKKRFPTREEVNDQIAEARRKLHSAAPDVPIARYPETHEDYAWKLLTHLKPFIQKRMDFFTEAAPLIKVSSNTPTILDRWTSIAAIARKFELGTDISLFLALISVSAPQKDSPGLGILKISHPYPAETAYNACLDISLMEICVNLQKIDSIRKYSIITSDVALARLGALLSNLAHRYSDGTNATFTATIPIELIGNDDLTLHRVFLELTSGQG